MRSRVVSGLPSLPSVVSSSVGTFGGGGGGGIPISTSITHLPRSTGDVRLASDVCTSMLPWPSTSATRAVGIGHPAELGARDVRNAVVSREALVHVRVVGREEVENAAIVLDDVVEEELASRAPSSRRAAACSPGTRTRRGEPSRCPEDAATAPRSASTAPRSADRRACA